MAVAPGTRRSRALGGLLRGSSARYAGLALLVAASSACTVLAPVVIRAVVDRIDTGTTAGDVRSLALLFLAIVVVGRLIGLIVVWVATTTAWDTTNRLRMELTEQVLGLDHEFHRTHTPGELISRVDGDVTSVSDFLGNVLPKVAGSALLVLGIIVVLGAIDWRLGVAMLVYFVLAVLAVMSMRHAAVDESADEMGATARMYGGIEERLNASEDIRANGAGQHARWRFVEETADYLKVGLRRASAFMRMWWTSSMAVTGGTVAAVAGSAWLVSRGSITVGTAFLLFQYVLLISRPLDEVIHEMETVQKASGAMLRVAELMDVRPSIRDLGTTSPAPGALAITAEQIDFDYGDESERAAVLHDVSLEIGAGRSVGVVGRTGSGKTTFSRLVLRLVEATGGTLRLGGVPIADIPLAELRRRVALVPQEVELFAGSVRDNVALFDPQPSDDDVRAALDAVGLSALSADLDRPLGPGGVGLSAGEAQLVSLARVWLRRPDVVVLDEATARVDPESEARLHDAVLRLIRGRTAVVIAHRLSTLRAVDDICVFEAGRVVEFGPRAELAADPSSRFHRLLTLALENVDGDGPDTLDELAEALPAEVLP